MRCSGICGPLLFVSTITISGIPEALMPSPEVHLEKKRKDYAFWRQFNEKPSIIPGCPGEVHSYINTNHGQKQIKQLCEQQQAACTLLLLFA